MLIAEEFRPPELDGSGEDPVWYVLQEDLGPELTYRPDPRRPREHGYIEPAQRMKLERYEQAVAATGPSWTRYQHRRE